jgi:Putative zinc-finger
MSEMQPTNEAFEDGQVRRPDDHGDWPSFETLSAYADGELHASEQGTVASHLDTCPFCRSIVADIELLSLAVRSVQAPAPSRSFRLTIDTPGIQLPVQLPSATTQPIPIESRRTLPSRLLPYATVIAAILLLTVFTGDLFSRQDGSSPSTAAPTSTPAVLIIDGTAFTEDDSSSIHAAGMEPTSQNSTSADQPIGANSTSTEPPIAVSSTNSDSNVNGWLIAEVLLGLTVALLLVTMLRGRASRKR